MVRSYYFAMRRWSKMRPPSDPAFVARLTRRFYVVAMVSGAFTLMLTGWVMWNMGDPAWLSLHGSQLIEAAGPSTSLASLLGITLTVFAYWIADMGRMELAGLPGDHPPILGPRDRSGNSHSLGLVVGVVVGAALLYGYWVLMDRAARAGVDVLSALLLTGAVSSAIACAWGMFFVGAMRRITTSVIARVDEDRVQALVKTPVPFWRMISRTSRVDMGLGGIGLVLVWAGWLLSYAASSHPDDPTVSEVVEPLQVIGLSLFAVGLGLATQAWRGGVKR